MVTSAPIRNVSEYYLQIQALTPVSDPNSPASAVPPTTFPAQIPALSIVIFLSVLVIGAFTLLLTKSRQINKMLVLLAIAFISSAVPLSMRSLSQEATYQSQAGPQPAPSSVIVTQVTASSFRIQWHTDKAETGTLRYGQMKNLEGNARIVSETTSQTQQEHSLVIDQLKPSTTYYLEILSGANWFNDHGRPITITTSSASP